MEQPINAQQTSTVPGDRVIDKPEHPPQGYVNSIVAETETVAGKGQLKVGRCRGYEVYCDEGPRIGGDSAYPPPMAYFALGAAF